MLVHRSAVVAPNLSSAVCRFGVFELDLKNRTLHGSGRPVDLQPQAFRVLELLILRPNELVTREQLQDDIWPGQSYADRGARLNFAIKTIRQALGDDANNPHYIETIRGSGYKFIASITTQHQEPVRSVSKRRRFPRLTIALAAAGALALGTAGLVLAMWPSISSVTPVLARPRQIIVIRGRGFGVHTPFANTNSSYLAIRDKTAGWAAGRIIPQNSDEVMVDVAKWAGSEIVVTGFSGDYDKKGWELKPGDIIEIAVWNPQTGIGPGTFRLRVSADPR